jgi:hypothetical protein
MRCIGQNCAYFVAGSTRYHGQYSHVAAARDKVSGRSQRNGQWLEPWLRAAARQAYTYTYTQGLPGMVCLISPTGYEQRRCNTAHAALAEETAEHGMSAVRTLPHLRAGMRQHRGTA